MAPSHLLSADDILVFANGNTKGLKHLSKWLEMYQESYGQIFSSEKSKLFLGAMSNTKKQKVKAILGIDEGCLPTTYLGIPLVQGITKGSSIWAGVRGAIEDVRAHSGWVIGDGASIDLWRDNWCSSFSLKD
ncbi:hypothetical protein GIB67_002310 [Kingdonia uniflora]|uniref:Reverse transcriptase domain-containing protein n=1 Tax=Kingdonia uniflora TaxID=39325 RepID=A0A7J7KX00_9MAGN|nr:hypothetical protein GIB67_002310 [Kingdonia uniflora]